MSDEKLTVLERLVKYLNYRSIPFARMERMAGFSNGYLRNNKGSISGTKLAEVIDCLPELNGDWLLTGRGPMEMPKKEEEKAHIVQGEGASGGRFAGHNYYEGSKENLDLEENAESEEGPIQQDLVVIVEAGKEIQIGIHDLHKRYLAVKDELDKLKDECIDLLKENKTLTGELNKLRKGSDS